MVEISFEIPTDAESWIMGTMMFLLVAGIWILIIFATIWTCGCCTSKVLPKETGDTGDQQGGKEANHSAEFLDKPSADSPGPGDWKSSCVEDLHRRFEETGRALPISPSMTLAPTSPCMGVPQPTSPSITSAPAPVTRFPEQFLPSQKIQIQCPLAASRRLDMAVAQSASVCAQIPGPNRLAEAQAAERANCTSSGCDMLTLQGDHMDLQQIPFRAAKLHWQGANRLDAAPLADTGALGAIGTMCSCSDEPEAQPRQLGETQKAPSLPAPSLGMYQWRNSQIPEWQSAMRIDGWESQRLEDHWDRSLRLGARISKFQMYSSRWECWGFKAPLQETSKKPFSWHDIWISKKFWRQSLEGFPQASKRLEEICGTSRAKNQEKMSRNEFFNGICCLYCLYSGLLFLLLLRKETLG